MNMFEPLTESTMISKIVHASTDAQLDDVRDLMRAFVGWHRQRNFEDLMLIDQYFSTGAFEQELATLPGKYAPPHGRLLLAFHNAQPAGCVALRPIDNTVCEMKRMFVYPEYQGRGVGRALASTLIQEAKTIGYTTMRLDTSYTQVEAQTLYQSLGFRRIAPYYELPPDLRNWLVFMELTL
jgi:putative acetyltransferase